MTRTDFTASSRPQAVAAGLKTAVPARRRSARRLIAVPVALALLVPATPALAQSSTSGYSQTPPVKTTPSNGTGPSTSSSPPKSETSTPRSSTPSTGSAAPTASSRSTLPFTGLDLRWIIGGGVLLMAAGLSIRLVQRRQGGDFGR
jgi:hypothetical protein